MTSMIPGFQNIMGMGPPAAPVPQQVTPLQVSTPAVSTDGASAQVLPPSPAPSLSSPAVSAPSPRVNLHLLSRTAAGSDVLPPVSSTPGAPSTSSAVLGSTPTPVVLPPFSALTGQSSLPDVTPVSSSGPMDSSSSLMATRDLTAANNDILASVLDRTVGPLNPDGTAESIFGVSPSVAGDHPPLSPDPDGRSPTFPVPSSESGITGTGITLAGKSPVLPCLLLWFSG
jgi:hypothetical protein